MSIQPVDPAPVPAHPVLAALDVIAEALDSVSTVNPTFLRTGVKAEVMRRVAVLQSRVAEVGLRVLADAQDVAMDGAARDAGVWLAHETRTGRGQCRADLALATELDRRRLVVAAGMRSGVVNLAQARVIAKALDRLPADVPAETVSAAEAHLVEAAARFGPEDLATLGRKVLEVVAPEIAEEVEARALAEEEAEAHEKTRLRLRRRGDGTGTISGVLPDHVITRLAVLLQAHTNPRKKDVFGRPAAPDGLDATDIQTELDTATANPGVLPDATDPVERLPHAHKLGLAFCALLENLDPRRLPIHGGDATTVVITMTLADLDKDHAVVEVLTTATIGGDPDGTSRGGGTTITAGQVRRMACNAGLVPLVLGGKSEILDQGRKQRLFTAAQNRALLLRDRTCRAEGCDIPGTWAEAHHWVWWRRGGPTDLANAVLLCSHHHHRAHQEDTYQAQRLANGDVRFTRRR